MLLVDHQIRALCTPNTKHVHHWNRGPVAHRSCEFVGPMLDPFSESVSTGVISYGLDHAGYCLRLAPEILMFKALGVIVDPKRSANDANYFNSIFEKMLVKDSFIIPAQGYVLGHSVEYIRMPRWLKGRCVGKSTLARVGIHINTTPLEPEWHGHLTIEIANESNSHVMVYVNEGICQLEFEVLDANPEASYADKKGKYQGQTGVTPARVL